MKNYQINKDSLSAGFTTLFTPLSKLLFLICIVPAFIFGQEGKIVREVIHSKSLEKTITGENSKRNVSIYLPPSYKKAQTKRYPVIYLLHGIADTDDTWTKLENTIENPEDNDGYATIQDVMNKGIAEGRFGEMIVVMPDEKTKWFGSFYVNSSATGNWDDFTSKELVSFIDRKYRTLQKVASRGIAGHSMGGYGALTLAMKHPDTFSVAYGMNSAIIDWSEELSLTVISPKLQTIADAKTFNDLLKTGDLYTMAFVNIAQAFSPNPAKPPFYIDMPFKKVGGKWKPSEPAFSKWRAHSPIRMVENYRENLNKLRGYRFDSGYDDEFRFISTNSRALSLELINNGIEHTFEEYNGDHRNKVWGKNGRLYTHVLPYFWQLLDH